MKNDLTETVSTLSPDELGDILEEKYGKKLGKSEKNCIYEKVRKRTGLSKSPSRLRYAIIAAVAAVLIAALSIGAYAYAADVKEYNEAVEYLRSIDFSTEGLTRKQIKTVYRTVLNSVQTDNGSETALTVPVNGSDLRDISLPAYVDGGVRYEIATHNDGTSYLQKRDGNTVLWSYDPEGVQIAGFCPKKDGGVFVCGSTEIRYGRGNGFLRFCPYYVMLDENGTVLMQTVDDDERISDFDYFSGNAECIRENEDGTFLCLGFCMTRSGAETKSYLTLTYIGKDGSLLSKKEVPTYELFGGKNFVLLKYCISFGDGFAAYISDIGVTGFNGLIRISTEGDVSKAIRYGEDGYEYIVADVISYNGRLLISADVLKTDRAKQNVYNTDRADLISAPLNALLNSDGLDLLSHECTDIVKSSCEAVLLVLDPDTDLPRAFYKESGALSGKLGIDGEGRLVWNTRNITGAAAYHKRVYSDRKTPVALEVIYSYNEYRYTFAEDGRSAVKIKTDSQAGRKF